MAEDSNAGELPEYAREHVDTNDHSIAKWLIDSSLNDL